MNQCLSIFERYLKAKSMNMPNCSKCISYGFKFIIVLIVLTGFWPKSSLSAPKNKPKFPNVSLMERARGERAIQVLADKLPDVAEWYGRTAEQFAAMIRKDHTCSIDRDGHLFFVDAFYEQAVGDETPSVSGASFPYDQTFKLHSLPGSKKVIYIDFDGYVTTGTAWNTSFGDPINSPAYNLDGDPLSFSNTELDRIQDIWKLVAEDFAPFDVDVTTEDPGQAAINRSSANDDRYGTRVVMTVDDFANCGCGGFAYVGVFGYEGSNYKPAFVFNESLVGAAEAVSHEAGHNLGLLHDGIKNGAAYYQGHGSGDTGWAPIMGVGYYQQLVHWSKGEYSNANNLEDDIQVIQNNGILLLADDHGSDMASSTTLDSVLSGSTITLSGIGLIERRNDVDFFSFMNGGGDVLINVNPAQLSPNLDIFAGLYDSSGTLIASSNPVDSLNASIDANSLPAGEYFVMVDGVGKGDPLSSGYSDYASLGQYKISGTASNIMDSDSDGYNSNVDCDDIDSLINPGAVEVFDGVDNDCDGIIDDGFADSDGDGYAIEIDDCDDTNAAINPGAVEVVYNGVDDDCDPATLDTVDFNGFSIQSYGGSSQDLSPTVTIEDGGATLRVTGNSWKKIAFPYTITANTILEFDFQSMAEGEIHGIGFDNDDILGNPAMIFKVHGTQSAAIQAYDNYAGETPRHYIIPVGQYYTGNMLYMCFSNDHDVAIPDAESVFKNIKVYEQN